MPPSPRSSAARLPTLAEIRAEQARRGTLKHLPRCRRSFAYFLKHFVWTADGGGTKIDPWPWQRDLARALPKFKRILTLKARQLGMSWIGAAYALWTALFQRGAIVLLVSQTEADAVDLLEKVKVVYDHLPEWLRYPRERVKDKTQSLAFLDLRSAIIALPSTQRAGRGKTARLVIADEHAFHAWAGPNYNALAPTIDAGGQFWSISTADGVGNFFADLCGKASETQGWCQPTERSGGTWRVGKQLREWKGKLGGNADAWLPLFLPYFIRPGRTPEWWEQKREAHPRPREFFQEYPRDPEEAFVQTGRPVFDKNGYLDAHKSLCREPLPRGAWPARLQEAGFRHEELRVFALPRPDHRYAAGADVAEGLEHGDWDDLTLFDADADGGKPVEVLSLHGHWKPDEFAELIDVVARLYPGSYGIERNNHGGTTLLRLRQLGTPGVYAELPILDPAGREVVAGKPGWETNKVSKPVMIDGLEEALRRFAVRLADELAYPELVFYQVLKDGSTGAPSGKHDDRVMSRAIAVQMLKFLPAPPDEVEEYAGPATFAATRW